MGASGFGSTKPIISSQQATPARRVSWVHPARTALAAVASMLVARLLRLPEPYWAPITTLVIAQSSLGAAWEVSKQRFLGTLLGAIVGSITALSFGAHSQLAWLVVAFTVGVFLLGLICQLVRVDRSGYRFGGVTLTIVLLIPRTAPAWTIAFHRFVEVSIGIAVALVSATLWPEKPEQ